MILVSLLSLIVLNILVHGSHTTLMIDMILSLELKKPIKLWMRSNFFDFSSSKKIREKFHIHLAIPINLLLQGCESWALNQDLLHKLEVFHLQCIRRILNIKRCAVVDLKITNEQIRSKFNNISSLRYMITKNFFYGLFAKYCKYLVNLSQQD